MSRLVVLMLMLGLCCSTAAQAQDGLEELSSPYAPLVREHYYEQLAKSPWRALGWELVVPGGGNTYTGVYAPALATLGLSVVGASLWVAGALDERPALLWTGVGLFASARLYGVVSAPLGAWLLNAAFRRQLGLSATY
jgi:hypothetical protein